jgi:hypothetical protein
MPDDGMEERDKVRAELLQILLKRRATRNFTRQEIAQIAAGRMSGSMPPEAISPRPRDRCTICTRPIGTDDEFFENVNPRVSQPQLCFRQVAEEAGMQGYECQPPVLPTEHPSQMGTVINIGSARVTTRRPRRP